MALPSESPPPGNTWRVRHTRSSAERRGESLLRKRRLQGAAHRADSGRSPVRACSPISGVRQCPHRTQSGRSVRILKIAAGPAFHGACVVGERGRATGERGSRADRSTVLRMHSVYCSYDTGLELPSRRITRRRTRRRRCCGGCPPERSAEPGCPRVSLSPSVRARRRAVRAPPAHRSRDGNLAERGMAGRGHGLDGSVRPVKRGEIWFADIGRGGDRPVLVLTRDPVADRIDAVVVAHLTTTIRGLTSELRLSLADGLRQDCVVSFDNLHTLPRSSFRRRVALLRPSRLDEACDRLADALGCGDR